MISAPPPFKAHPRRSLWMFGFEADEPTEEQRTAQAARLHERFGVEAEHPATHGAPVYTPPQPEAFMRTRQALHRRKHPR